MIKGNKREILQYMNNQDPDRIYKIKMFRKKRTLPQNSMFHVLFHMIAHKMGVDEEIVKKNMMKAAFGTKKIEWKTHNETFYFEDAVEPSTKNLTIQQGIFLIEIMIEFGKTLGLKFEDNYEKQFLEYYDNNIY